MTSLSGHLTKKATVSIKPGRQGVPYVPAQPARPGYWSTTIQRINACVDTGADPPLLRRVVYILDEDDQSLKIDLDQPGACEYPVICGKEIIYSNTPCPPGYASVEGKRTVSVWNPPFPGIPGQAAQPGTKTQIDKNLNVGWGNSCSSSIKKVNVKQYIKFSVAAGIQGVLVALGEKNSELQKFSAYKHCIILSKDGAVVFEQGVPIIKLAESFTPEYEFRIYRNKDGTITYSSIYQNRNDSYESESLLNETQDIHAYAVLYRAEDTILSASIENIVEYKRAPEAVITQKFSSFSGTALKTVATQYFSDKSKSIPYARILQRFSSDSNSYGRAVLNAKIGYFLASLCSGPFKNRMNAKLSFDRPNIEDSPYVPPDLQGVYSNIPEILVKMHGFATRTGTLSASFSLIQAKSLRRGSAYLNSSFPAMSVKMRQAVDGYAFINNYMTCDSSFSATIDRVIELVSVLSVEDSFSVSKESLAVLLSSIEIDDSIETSTDHFVSIESELSVDSFISATINDLPDFSGGAAWVINIESGAVTLFKDYGFNSIQKFNGESYGFANDGIYKLTSTASLPKQSYIDFGNLNARTYKKKRISNWYASMSSSGRVFLKLIVDGRSYTYEFRSSGTGVENRRADSGRGLFAVFYNPIIIAPEGVKIEELNSLTFDPVVFDRRI